MRAVVFTLGCKVNRTESEGLMEELKQYGFEVTDVFSRAEPPADLYIINTCAITSDAERKSRQAVARALNMNKNARIIVIGCASQNDFRQFRNVTAVSGTANKRLDNLLNISGIKIDSLPECFEEAKTKAAHTRAFIKIQDGCDNFCSYCIVPHLRGRSRSRSTQNILEDIKLQDSARELVLTGINISKFGQEGGGSLVGLIKQINQGKRVRLGSLEIGIINESFLSELSNIPNFCDHFHLSLQSCSDSVLKAMNRHYTVANVFAAVDLIRRYFPNGGITADIIAGFPTETLREHEETIQNLKKLRLYDIHVFPFSSRVGTAAAELKDLSYAIKKVRAAEISLVSEKCKREFLSSQISRTVEVLTEKGNNGLSKNYIRVYFDKKIPANDIINVRLTELYKNGMKGEIL